MDYENKLLLAKEALDSGSYDKETIEYIFPELKESEESEDEKIRKAIINVFATHKDYEIFFGVSVEDILAWLEKQDKSSSKVHYWTEEEIEPIINDYLTGAEHYGGMIGRLRCLKPKSLEKQGKNNMGISEATKQELRDNLNKTLEKETPETWNEFLDKQKPAEWNEEDKKKLGRIYSILGQAADEHAFSNTCRLIGDKECVELQDFLKSLKDSVGCEVNCTTTKEWKPSDEQMEALERCVDYLGESDNEYAGVIASLCLDLKFL